MNFLTLLTDIRGRDMFALILIAWLLINADAPLWCYVLLTMAVMVKLIQFGIDIGEKSNGQGDRKA
jgi:hypothetical protein